MEKSYLEELEQKEKVAELRRQKVIESHKCYRCEWSNWTGSKYMCMFPRCFK